MKSDNDGPEGWDINDILNQKGLSDAMSGIRGEFFKQTQGMLSRLSSDFKGVAEATGELVGKIEEKKEDIQKHLESSKRLFDPDYDKPFGKLNEVYGYGSIGFFKQSFFELYQNFGPAYKDLFTISELYNRFVKNPLFHKTSNTEDLRKYIGSIEKIINITSRQMGWLPNFENLVAKSYLATREYHKQLKIKYEGSYKKENITESIFSKLFEKESEKKDTRIEKQKIKLINNNCVLTETLMEIVDNLPRPFETVIPLKKDGKTRVIKKIDDGEIQNTADILINIANPIYLKYLKNPDYFTDSLTKSIKIFYSHFKRFEPCLRKIMHTVRDVEHIEFITNDPNFYKGITDPTPATNRLQRLNFLSIRPTNEEVSPKSRIEKDYANARSKLLHHLNKVLENIEKMPTDYKKYNIEKEKFAINSVKTAITLKEKMDEITSTERDRRLKSNIREENEFYVGRTGEIGAFISEREPSPKIKYKDIAGESFNRAKEHVEEVINIAAFPQILKASAPRGKIKSNLLLIGPYGCGKTEFARAIAGDKRVIGLYVGVSDVLTAYMHESVKNVKRVWEEAKELRKKSRYTKPVAIIQDEFDAWFEHGNGFDRHGDSIKMERTLQEVMDGIVEYDGLLSVALTNKPGVIPDAILRRFKYVDVVGQLTTLERTKLFKHFLTRGMPISPGIKNKDYDRWAGMLEDAPGDVLGKIADEVHFKFMKEYIQNNPKRAANVERHLTTIEKERDLNREEHFHVKRKLSEYRKITRKEIDSAVEYMLKQPAVQKEINSAKEVYREADKILKGLVEVGGSVEMGFTRDIKSKSKIWTPNK